MLSSDHPCPTGQPPRRRRRRLPLVPPGATRLLVWTNGVHVHRERRAVASGASEGKWEEVVQGARGLRRTRLRLATPRRGGMTAWVAGPGRQGDKLARDEQVAGRKQVVRCWSIFKAWELMQVTNHPEERKMAPRFRPEQTEEHCRHFSIWGNIYLKKCKV